MEISLMVSQLKSEAESVESSLADKKSREASIRLELAALEEEIRSLTEKHAAIRGAIDRLNPVCKESDPVGGVHAIKVQTKTKGHSTKPRKIGKFDANGVKIGEYPSITQAAKEFGWNNVPMTKYIANTSRDKQIRLRGYYLEFIAA